MAIFDNVRGLMPLPRSKKGNYTSDVDSSTKGVSNEIFSHEVPIPLPKFNQPDTSNTFIDNVYTQINDVFEYIHLPTPAIVQDIYGFTQSIENIINDPVTEIRNAVNREIYDLLHPSEKNIFPADRSGSEKKSEEVKGLVFYDDTKGTSGNRAPLLEDDVTMSKKNLRPGSYLSNLDEPELNRSFQGRETLQNSTLRSIDLWDLSIEPFEYRGVKNKWVPNIQQENNAIVNVTSKYADIFPKNYPKITDYMPILSYDLDLKTITSKQLDLFGGSSISVPDMIRYTSQLSVQIVDDENKRWRRWFQTYSENLYDERTTSVAPYKNSSLLITLYQYRQDFKILSHNQYICTLNNYQMISSGASSASTDVLDVELSIVGKVDLPEIYSYLEIV